MNLLKNIVNFVKDRKICHLVSEKKIRISKNDRRKQSQILSKHRRNKLRISPIGRKKLSLTSTNVSRKKLISPIGHRKIEIFGKISQKKKYEFRKMIVEQYREFRQLLAEINYEITSVECGKKP